MVSLKRLKVLIIAHEFSPDRGSECAVGWNLITRLATFHDVTVIYASGNQTNPNCYNDAITEFFLERPPILGLNLKSIKQPWLTRFIAFFNSLFKKIGPIGLPALYYIGYNKWQKVAYKEAKILYRCTSFDIVHQLTQISFREPGYMWRLGIPFIWGPTGGLANMPWKFYKTLPFPFKLIEGIRFVSNVYHSNFVSRITKANNNAAIIYTYSHEDARYFEKRARGKIKYMLDVGTRVIPKYFHDVKIRSENITGIWCGQLTYRKALSILLYALAASQLTREQIRIKVVGAGPLEKSVHTLADKLKLENIEWIGQVSHQEVLNIMVQADFLIHTSLREATSSVIPEALSIGLPVICHDVNGMSFAVTETCGIKIPLISPEHSIRDFHVAIKRLVLDRNLLERLSIGAKERSLEISWDKMAETIAKDYLIVAKKGQKNILK